MKPFFDQILKFNHWNYYDSWILINSISYTTDIKEAIITIDAKEQPDGIKDHNMIAL